MSRLYIYNVEFTVDDRDLWSSPPDIKNPDDYPTIFRFEIESKICLEITDEEYIEQVNCDKKKVKNKMFSMSGDDISCEIEGKIKVIKSMGVGCEATMGFYEISKLNSIFQNLMEEFDRNSSGDKICGISDPCLNQPTMETIRELVQLVNDDGLPAGSLLYTLRITCFGPSITMSALSQFSNAQLRKSPTKDPSHRCLTKSKSSCPCSEYDEYAAEVNGNQLIVRVLKSDKSYHVTRVFDSDMDQNGNEVRRDKNVLTILGCDQQIDMKFPGNFSCGDGDAKKKNCGCGGNSMLTEFQKKTSCAGKSFKNAPCLPVIRGNLKYPGRMEGMLDLKLYDRINPCDATEKYKVRPLESRAACLQVDSENMKREIEGKCPLPRGIEVCKKGCSDPNFDEFVLKIGKQRTNKKGQKSLIELEMRTPKGPDNERKKMESREVQVEESEFDDFKKSSAVKKGEAGSAKPSTQGKLGNKSTKTEKNTGKASISKKK